MIKVLTRNLDTLGAYRLPLLIGAALTALVSALYFGLVSPAIPLMTGINVTLALLAAWAVGGLFLFLARKYDNYSLVPAGILAYALTVFASALLIGLQELAAGTSGAAAFLLIAATLSPVLVLVLQALLNPGRFAE